MPWRFLSRPKFNNKPRVWLAIQPVTLYHWQRHRMLRQNVQNRKQTIRDGRWRPAGVTFLDQGSADTLYQLRLFIKDIYAQNHSLTNL